MGGNFARVFCMRREFSLFSSNKSSPIVEWLRSLCREVRDRTGTPGVGVIGMCLTGNFAISLMGDESVLAGVASQPAMPFHSQSALHMSDAEVTAARESLEESNPMLALRFEEDKMCSAAKFASIDEAFNSDGRERVCMKTLPGKGHSVLTLDFVDQAGHPTHTALAEVIEYFQGQLSN
jgi:dienelactone hydrolase